MRGEQRDDVAVVRGVPLAASPLGPRRFAASAPPPPGWRPRYSGLRSSLPVGGPAVAGEPGRERVRRAVRAGRPAHQRGLPPPQRVDSRCRRRPPARDGMAAGRRLPPGTGAAAMYDGSALDRRGDVVAVTLNYRLDVLGHLHVPEIGGGQPGAARPDRRPSSGCATTSPDSVASSTRSPCSASPPARRHGARGGCDRALPRLAGSSRRAVRADGRVPGRVDRPRVPPALDPAGRGQSAHQPVWMYSSTGRPRRRAPGWRLPCHRDPFRAWQRRGQRRAAGGRRSHRRRPVGPGAGRLARLRPGRRPRPRRPARLAPRRPRPPGHDGLRRHLPRRKGTPSRTNGGCGRRSRCPEARPRARHRSLRWRTH